ncbi:hypothetical protein Bbelb_365320 [Branchiostoma belcheri]|nr:hypothetical protein Bbelb_365320 [Branchiostoma belcheri]
MTMSEGKRPCVTCQCETLFIVKVLEDAGILPQITRFAGTSAGAITAALLAIGLTPQEMLEELSSKNLLEVVLDARGKPFHWIPGMKRFIQVVDLVARKGACPGLKFMKWFGEILERHLKKRGLPLDKDIYHVLGVELCIVAYNVNYDVESYFHVKTTPILRVREAVRMSMSIPGWYLSMDKSLTFHRHLQSMGDLSIHQLFYPEYRKDRFKPPESGSDEFFKTLGALVFSSNNREVHQYLFERRLQKLPEVNPEFHNQRPPTKKARKYAEGLREKKDLTEMGKESLARQMQQLGTIIQVIFGKDETDGWFADTEQPEGTTLKTLSGTGNHMTTEEARRLFYKTINERDVKRLQVRTKEEAFKMLLLNEKGELTDNKIKNLYQNFLPLQNAKMEILGERPVSTAGQYYGTLMDFVGSKNQLTEEDVGRCIGVDVDYLSTMDFDMEPADMEFLMKQGVVAATTFLCEYIDKQTRSSASRQTPIFLVAER